MNRDTSSIVAYPWRFMYFLHVRKENGVDFVASHALQCRSGTGDGKLDTMAANFQPWHLHNNDLTFPGY